MEPFKVTCVTCRARLTVRDESAIGQIFACPRCSSMVHVVAPAAAAAIVPSAVSKTAPAPSAAPTPAPLEDASFVFDADPTPPQSAPPAASSSTFEDAAEIDGVADQGAAAPVAAPPFAGWGPLKFAAVTASAALAGSALVAAVLMLVYRNPAPAAAPAVVAQAVVEPAPSTPAAAPITSANPTPSAEEPADADPAAVTEPTAPAEANVEPTPSPPTPATAADDDLRTGRLSDQSPPPEPAPIAAAEPEQPKPRLRIDPLEFDPEGLDLRTLTAGPANDPLAASQAAAPSEEAAASMAPPPIPAAEPAPHDPADAPVRREAPAGAAAQQANVAALAERKYPSVKVDGMPLARFIDFAGEMSGLPVSVAPEVLRRAAVNSATAVKCDAKDATIESALAAALEKLRLAPKLDGSQLVLERLGGDKQRKVEYKVDDLAPAAADVQQLAERLQQFAAPATWQTAGGAATLAINGQTIHVDALESTQYEALFFLERYRAALGLPTRSKYPAGMLAPSSPHAELAERLQAPTTFTFSQYTPLREIFRYWHDELDVALLVDWPALDAERLAPQTRIAASSVARPWTEALDAVLTPLGLAWRAIDARTIEITSLTHDREHPEIAFYRLAAGAKVDAASLTAQVDQIASETDAASAGAPAAARAIDYDAAHRLLMVRLPAAAHRRLAAWLAEQSLLAAR